MSAITENSKFKKVRNGWMVSSRAESIILIYAVATIIYGVINIQEVYAHSQYTRFLALPLYFLIFKLLAPWSRIADDYQEAVFNGKFSELITGLQKEGFELLMMGNNKYVFDTKNVIAANTRCIVYEQTDGTYIVVSVLIALKKLAKNMNNITLVDKTNE